MNIESAHIIQLAGTIWQSMLGLFIIPVGADPAAPTTGRSTAACIQITGAWNGAVLLDCSTEVAQTAASIMFSIDLSAVSINDMQDAVAELVNMIGGNLKALLPETCFLSLPTAVEGGELTARIPGSRLVTRAAFDCEGSTVTIAVREKAGNSAVAA